MALKILVTGATGYIGSAFVRLAIARGHVVVAATRRPAPKGCDWLPYELGGALNAPNDIDAIVHLAADTGNDSPVPDIEMRAIKALIHGATTQRAQFVFVSSQTSRPNAPTKYGRDKWMSDQYVLAQDGWVVRPGQVYGGEERGLFGTLVSMVRRLPVLPAFMPAPCIQPIHVEDCAEGILRVVERRPLDRRVFHLAAAAPVTFSSFLRAIAHRRLRRRIRLVPFPGFTIRAITMAFRRLGVTAHSLERVMSLLDIPRVDSASDLEALELRLRGLKEGMSRAGSTRRLLIEEASALLRYVLRSDPPRALLAHYVHSVEQIRNGVALDLPPWMIGCPCLIALIDTPSILGINEELKWRIDAATAIAEASPLGFRRFMRAGRSSMKVVAILEIGYAIAAEAGWRTMRLLARPLVGRVTRHIGAPTND